MLSKSCTNQEKHIEFWNEIATENGWPPIVLAKDCDRETLPGFPYKKNYFRNLLTGKDKDETLETFKIGKLLAAERDNLVAWLARRTS